MPVPLSVTNPKGAGLAAQVAAELPTGGSLFAGLGSSQGAAQQQAQPQAEQQQQQVQQQAPAGATACGVASSAAGVAAVATHSLTFSYPDIGEHRPARSGHTRWMG